MLCNWKSDHCNGISFPAAILCGDPNNTHSTVKLVDSSWSEDYLDTVQYDCRPQHNTITGKTTITCQADGTWSDPPFCYCEFDYFVFGVQYSVVVEVVVVVVVVVLVVAVVVDEAAALILL